MEDIASSVFPYVPLDTGKKIHPNIDYDQAPFPTRVTPVHVPHESVDDDPPGLVNLEVMDLSIGNHRNIMHLLASILPIWSM